MLLFLQGCAESRHHLSGAPETDPVCHTDSQSAGYPDARPRSASLTDPQQCAGLPRKDIWMSVLIITQQAIQRSGGDNQDTVNGGFLPNLPFFIPLSSLWVNTGSFFHEQVLVSEGDNITSKMIPLE